MEGEYGDQWKQVLEDCEKELGTLIHKSNKKDSKYRWLLEIQKRDNLLDWDYKNKPKPPVGDWIPLNGEPPQELKTWSNKYMLPIPGYGACVFGEGGNPEYEPKYKVYLDWFFDKDVDWYSLTNDSNELIPEKPAPNDY